jgi:hypothetical protein
MTKHSRSSPPAKGRGNDDERRARLAETLRENLRKRKEQARVRAATAPEKARDS